ncbi:MAG: restriction endonuclease [Neisseria sp.]|nr:restriction endonuclease [Neisseria sp.]
MPPIVITAPDKLAAAQTLFAQTLRGMLPQKAVCTIACLGGAFEAETAYSPELDLWYAAQGQGRKYWNGFGVGAPSAGKKLPIAAEINFPSDGLNRAVAGVFADDGKGGILVLHRGKIRGGKDLFFRHFRGETVVADDGGKEEALALVGRPGDTDFAARLAAFVAEILRIKAAAKGG